MDPSSKNGPKLTKTTTGQNAKRILSVNTGRSAAKAAGRFLTAGYNSLQLLRFETVKLLKIDGFCDLKSQNGGGVWRVAVYWEQR